jgi:hypothetical protein
MKLGRRSSEDTAAGELTELEHRRDALPTELEAAQAALSAAEARREEVAEAEGRAYIDRTNDPEVDQLRDDVEGGIAAARREVERVQAGAHALESRIAAKRDEIRRAQRDAAAQNVRELGRRRNERAADAGAQLAAAADATQTLSDARLALKTGIAELEPLLGLDESLGDVLHDLVADEPKWAPPPATLDKLVELVKAGPDRPAARTAAALQQYERDRAQSERDTVERAARRIVMSPGGSLATVTGRMRERELERVPEALRDAVLARVAELKAEHRARIGEDTHDVDDEEPVVRRRRAPAGR